MAEAHSTEELVLRYWKSWQIPDWTAMRSCLADSFNFGGQILDADQFIAFCKQGAPWQDVELLATVFSPSSGALLYEGTDSKSGDRIRVGEFVQIENGKLIASHSAFGTGMPPGQ